MDTKITITPEGAAALYEQWRKDFNDYLNENDHQMSSDAHRHALTLAITRERERCLSIIREVNALNADDPRLIVSKRVLEEIEKRIRGEE